MIKFALIKERKNPPDRRVVFSPEKLKEAVQQFPEANFKIESSDIRIFPDQAYTEAGFEVSDDISDCDVMLGVKEVPIDALIQGKKYLFFSHTIKQQPFNRNLLRAILEKNIELYDHEVVTKPNGLRLIGFGRYAGIVGAYNGFRAIGLKEGGFTLPKVQDLSDMDEMKLQLESIEVPPVKVVLTGSGKVASGAMEILDYLKIKRVSIEEYLDKDFREPVFCQIDVLDYSKRIDGKIFPKKDFYDNPEEYESNFHRFSRVSDMFIAGHFYGEGAPVFFTESDTRSPDFRIRYIADISCDIKGPIASTIRASTIADPIYGYNTQTGKETDFRDKDALVVMAVDNLPCELPKDSSQGFGEMFLEHVLPAFFNNDRDGILQRAQMTRNGQLTERFSYLKEYAGQ